MPYSVRKESSGLQLNGFRIMVISLFSSLALAQQMASLTATLPSE